MQSLVTITIRSTHYYLIDADQSKLMVDTGWAGGLPALKSQLKRYAIDLGQIRYIILTHHHPDHAGLTQEIKQAGRARLINAPTCRFAQRRFRRPPGSKTLPRDAGSRAGLHPAARRPQRLD